MGNCDSTDHKARIALKIRAWFWLLLALLPTLLAVWSVPAFVTQDGPAHLYNAHILVESFGSDSPFANVYEVRWQVLPNWAGHLTLMALLGVLPPLVTDKAMMSLTLFGFAGAIFWMRRRVSGDQGEVLAALLAAFLSLNVTWLLGFYNFLIGVILFPMTLGYWWLGRERPGPCWAAVLVALLILGYFGHLVSLGLTAFGLLVLALATPGSALEWRRRLGWTLAALACLIPFALIYQRLTASGGAFRPSWGHLARPFELRAWFAQVGWVDPITLGSRSALPMIEAVSSPAFALLTPVLWFSIALFLLVVGTTWTMERRAWAWLSGILLIGGLVGPDRFGPDHGDYLGQRVVLLGLVALLPALDLAPGRRWSRIAKWALVLGFVLQSAFVWDYARESNQRVRPLLEARPFVGQGERVGTLLVGLRGRFRANPLLHADNLLGIGNGNILWSNYETRFYYFPVRVREGIEHPPAVEFERVARLDGLNEAPERARKWRELLETHVEAIDILIVRGFDSQLEAINARWFDLEPVFQSDSVRVFRRSQVESTIQGLPLPWKLPDRKDDIE